MRIRFIQLAREAVRAKARTRFGVGVRSDVRRFRWRFAGRRGRARPGLLVLRAPRLGRYTLSRIRRGVGNHTEPPKLSVPAAKTFAPWEVS